MRRFSTVAVAPRAAGVQRNCGQIGASATNGRIADMLLRCAVQQPVHDLFVRPYLLRHMILGREESITMRRVPSIASTTLPHTLRLAVKAMPQRT